MEDYLKLVDKRLAEMRKHRGISEEAESYNALCESRRMLRERLVSVWMANTKDIKRLQHLREVAETQGDYGALRQQKEEAILLFGKIKKTVSEEEALFQISPPPHDWQDRGLTTWNEYWRLKGPKHFFDYSIKTADKGAHPFCYVEKDGKTYVDVISTAIFKDNWLKHLS